MKDIFSEANATYTITALWKMLRLPGSPPQLGTKFSSPFRPDEHPSCDISKDDRWFSDRSRGDHLDRVGFVREASGGDWTDTRAWFLERMGIDTGESPTFTTAEPEKRIQWPGDLVTGNEETWTAFAKKRGLSYRSVYVAVQSGILRFVMVNGIRCFVITDEANKAGEIRRCDGGAFNGEKVYRLKGVDKSWLPGAAMLKHSKKETGIFITEGTTDLLTAFHLLCRYRMEVTGILNSWQPIALLGAANKTLHPELVPWFRGRHVRLVPDGDNSGRIMAANWRELLLEIGCTVDVVILPEGKDLTDVKDEIEPEELFS